MDIQKNEINNKINYYKKIIQSNKKDYNSIYALSKILFDNLKLEESIYYLNLCLKINPVYEKAKIDLINAKEEKKNLITYLKYNNPKGETSNLIIKCNQKLQNIKCDFDLGTNIFNEKLFLIIKQSQKIIKEEILDTEHKSTQIFREGLKKYYECERHFEVFNRFNIIPKNCFDCYKVLIEPETVIDLIKLYFVFDLINDEINLTRKCMIEIRENFEGKYKGLIYCVGIDQANITLKKINPIINNSINENIKRSIQRGCVEYSLAYPNYKKINSNDKNFMKYNPKWQTNEDIIDNERSKRKINTTNIKNTLNGITLNDALVINNWLVYAKKIGDKSYKNFL